MTLSGKYFLFAVIAISSVATYVSGDDCDRFDEFTVKVVTEKDAEFFKELLNRAGELKVKIDQPARHLNSTTIFRVPLCTENQLKDLLKKHGLENCKSKSVEASRRSLGNNKKTTPTDVDINESFKSYLSSDEINIYLDKVAADIKEHSPNIDVTILEEATTYENRSIKSITIGYHGKSNPIVVIDAGVHAREWHARNVALYIIHKLQLEAKKGEEGVLFNVTFIIVPNVNPDGYEFSRDVDNMWRKNRRPVTDKCIGVDVNRNYDVHWQLGDREKDPCEEVYKGSEPFSEIETRAIRDLLVRVKSTCFLYISIHTFGNSILFPNGWAVDRHNRYDKLLEVASMGAHHGKGKNGKAYKVDQSGSGLYVAAGGSDDWAIDALNIPFAYTFEVGEEQFGFQLPEALLPAALNESYRIIKAMTYKALSLVKKEVILKRYDKPEDDFEDDSEQ